MNGGRRILIIVREGEEKHERLSLLGQDFAARTVSCLGQPEEAARLIAANDGRVDAIALVELPLSLSLGHARVAYGPTASLAEAATRTPVVDGGRIRAGLERWGTRLADRAEPGIFSDKRILMLPGLNHPGLAAALGEHGRVVRYGDPAVFFDLPQFPGVGARATLERAAGPMLDTLRRDPLVRLFPSDQPVDRRGRLVRRADLLAGDVQRIRRWASAGLDGKTVVVECADPEDVADLRRRGVAILVTMMPSLVPGERLARHPAAVVEAALAALRPSPTLALTEDTYLNMIADLDWRPGIEYLQPAERDLRRFAFAIHPLSVRMISRHPWFRWTRILPDGLVERAAARLPPMFYSKVTGACSPATGQRVEGYLYTLGATPRMMMRRGVRSTYRKLQQIADRAQRRGARIMGLGAFTSVIGDAGKTVAENAAIAVTSGNSLTVAATLEAAKQAVISMGVSDLTRGRAMVVGATGSIGAVCARLLAQAVRDVVLISIEPDRLIQLKRRILRETPGARVVIGTRAADHLPECDLVVTATSAFGQRVVDLSRCKPGAVVCDVARPHDISPEEAAARPDVLVIDSGEVLIPGEIDFGADIGLPPGVAYACLAETCLLAMEGRFEDYTIGRDIEMERVKDIYRLFRKHGFRIAGLHSFDADVTEAQIAGKRRLAETLRADPELLARTMTRAAAVISALPVAAKGVRPDHGGRWLPTAWLGRLLDRLDRRLAPNG
jgi:predicted amino acid dehydrogenase